MVKVECDGCKAPYQIDEKRIPPAGLKMRCPKCGTNLVVMKPGSGDAEADLPAAARADAVKGAQSFVWNGIKAGVTLGVGHGNGPVDHLWALRSGVRLG